MNYFKGLIKCKACGKNYNKRNEHGIEVFICSTAKNYGKAKCPDSPRIRKDELLDIIKQHCSIHNKDFNLQKLKLFVKQIDVDPKEGVTIYYKDGSKSIWTENQIIF